MRLIRRGDIFRVNLDPVQDNEAAATRPAIVVTSNVASAHGTTVCVVPLTTNVERIYPFQVFLEHHRTGLEFDSKAQVEHLRSVSVRRIRGDRMGFVPDDLMVELNARIRLHLAL